MARFSARSGVSHATAIALLTAFAGLAVPASVCHAQVHAEGRLAAAENKRADELPIRRITLYRSGVGSFERRGLVQGNADVQLRFKTEQVNDILKSMVVLDLSKKGEIDGISYGSKEPLNRRLSSFAVDISGNPTLGNLLAALRGSEVIATFPDSTVEGVILGVETKMEPQGKDIAPIAVEYLNLVTVKGLRSFKLALASSIELKDKSLNDELGKALSAVAEYRADRTKTVEVNFRGEGARDCVVAYVQESPVWKTSYRLVLPDGPKKGEKAPKKEAGVTDRFTMQAWAIVENTTDEDWKDVALSLVAGRPVSFRMDLYEPLYVYRPEIPVPTVPGVMPRQYAGGVDSLADRKDAAATVGRGEAARRMRTPGSPPPASAASPFKENAERAAEYDMPAGISAEDMAGYAARGQGSATEAGEVFMYEVDHPVTVERQRSAMIPLVNAGIDGRRVSIFNPSDGGEHPMRGLEIINSTNLQFMPGPISVYDGGAYAGDAQIGHVPAGDKRLLAYAVDLELNFTTEGNSTEKVRKVRIVRGTFDISSMYQQMVKYTFVSKDKVRDRTVIVEQPRLDGWKLAEPAKPSETTQSLYRFEVPVEADGKNSINIVQELVQSRSVGLMGIDSQTLLEYSKQGEVSKKVFEAFAEAHRLQAIVGDHLRTISGLEKQKADIDVDQNRLRQNMQSIDRTTELYKRYLAKLTEQETKLEKLAEQIDAARDAKNAAEAAFNNYVASLNVD